MHGGQKIAACDEVNVQPVTDGNQKTCVSARASTWTESERIVKDGCKVVAVSVLVVAVAVRVAVRGNADAAVRDKRGHGARSRPFVCPYERDVERHADLRITLVVVSPDLEHEGLRRVDIDLGANGHRR